MTTGRGSGDAVALIKAVRAGLEQAADPAAAPAMAAYMKTTQPFYGVSAAQRRPLIRGLWRAHRPVEPAAWQSGVSLLFEQGKGASRPAANPVPPRRDSTLRPPLWSGPREWFYVACDYAELGAAFIHPRQLPHFQAMIVQSGWWDVVDTVAAKLVGACYRVDAPATAKAMERWIGHENLWVRRAAIISQLSRRADTDTDLLARVCLACAGERDFFMRKAIGWALRQYARTDPAWVRAFAQAHLGRLSSLTLREATRRL